MTVTPAGRPTAPHQTGRLSPGSALVVWLALLAIAASASMALALPPEGKRGSDLTVGPAAICRDVQEHEPIDIGDSFPPDVGRLYCFTRVNGAAEPTHVTHVWFHNDREVHRVELNVDGPTWRTWTYKTIPPEWTGDWRVDIEDAEGVIIYSLPFRIGAETPGDEPSGGQPGR